MLNRNRYILSFPKEIQKTGTFSFFLIGFTVAIALLVGCQPNTPKATEASPTQEQKQAASPSTPKPVVSAKPKKTQATKPSKSTPKSKQATKPSKPTPKSKAAAPKTVAVNIYQLDNQCNRFIAKKENLAANQPVTQAIAKVLENLANSDLEVSGYRVKVASGVATIDLRRATNASRPLRSFSNCEQLALFGSLRRTLTGNRVLKIKSVQFRDRGQPIKPQ